jgi:hypothetical protein
MIVVVALATTVSGCASLPSRHSFGVRPDVPVGGASPEVTKGCLEAEGLATDKSPDKPTNEYRGCLAFNTVVEWSANLEEAYRSRATHNRWWIYVAGTLGLATVGASAGLAAAGAATLGTIALLGVSGGFTAGFFGFLDNSHLADIYTIAADEIATTRSDARKKVADALSKKADGTGSSPSVAAIYYT